MLYLYYHTLAHVLICSICTGPPAMDEDESLVDQLKEMGFPEELSREALRRTKNDSISAMDWLLENEKVV